MIKYQVVEKTLCKTCANNVHLAALTLQLLHSVSLFLMRL